MPLPIGREGVSLEPTTILNVVVVALGIHPVSLATPVPGGKLIDDEAVAGAAVTIWICKTGISSGCELSVRVGGGDVVTNFGRSAPLPSFTAWLNT